jgi:hypothetical protein
VIIFLLTIIAGLFTLYVIALCRVYRLRCELRETSVELDRAHTELMLMTKRLATISQHSEEWRKHAIECQEIRLRLLSELAQANRVIGMKR